MCATAQIDAEGLETMIGRTAISRRSYGEMRNQRQ